MFARIKKTGGYGYLQLVENHREGNKVKQTVIATLGRFDQLNESGKLNSLLRSLTKHSGHAILLEARDKAQEIGVETRRIGAPLLFQRLWERTGCAAVIQHFLSQRKFEIPIERIIFSTVMHRILSSGSDRECVLRWLPGYHLHDLDELHLHQWYRAMAWLGEILPASAQQIGKTPFAPRCTKDLIEERLFALSRDLFTEIDVAFFDTTTLYFEGEGGDTIGCRGHNKDGHPELPQMVVGVVMDNTGRPICCEMWPGNTADVSTLIPIVDRLRKRFGIRSVCVVADRGMISAETISELEKRRWEYILGARLRNTTEVCEDVLGRAGRYQTVHPPSADPKAPSPLKVKEVWVDDHRYVVCLNPSQARKDASDREAIVESLKAALRCGDKSLVGNKGYRKYLRTGDHDFSIDEEKISEEARYDGKWVLRTNTSLSSSEVALKYKQLWMVESLFRMIKSLFETRPIYHKLDETIRGHVFCSFLALKLMNELQSCLETHGIDTELCQVLSDINMLTEVDVIQDNKRFVLRSNVKGVCGKVFGAVGVAMPPTIRQVEGCGAQDRLS
jgi:hypothetical protein